MLSNMNYLLIFSCIIAFSVIEPRTVSVTSKSIDVSQTQISQLTAFGKAYGYVRYFYPANLESVDWEKFCIKGIAKLSSNKKQDITATLQTIFQPIAPEVSFDDSARINTKLIVKRKTQLVFHEYLDLNTGTKYSDFKNYLRTISVDAGQDYLVDFLASELAPKVYINMPLAASPVQTSLSSLNNDLSSQDMTNSMKTEWLCKAIITWNIIQHFYPYRDDIVEWDKMLSQSISSILSASGNDACKEAYMKMIVALSDGHAAYMDKESQSANFCLPLELTMIGNGLFVKDTILGSASLQPGDEIKSINGKNIAKLKEEADAAHSGGEGFKKQLFCLTLISGNKSDTAQIVYRRNNSEKLVNLAYEFTPSKYSQLMVKKRPDSIYFDNRSIAYFDLSKWEYKGLKKMIPAINKLKGVVFDLRGYPTADMDYLLQHLITNKDTASHWISVPLIKIPDFKLVDFKTEGWQLTPSTPRINTKTIFLCDSRTYSFAESILGFIKDYKLGTIIGEASAGANGDMNYISFKDKSSFSWSAVKVTTPTGKHYKSKGIDADIVVMQTPTSIASGIDLPLSKALEEIRK
jgi:C-terminal processing protease CtpA/Prc